MTDEKDLQKFDFQAKIKEKMKKLFVDIIPEEQWDHIVKTEHDKFVEMELVNMQQNRY